VVLFHIQEFDPEAFSFESVYNGLLSDMVWLYEIVYFPPKSRAHLRSTAGHPATLGTQSFFETINDSYLG
jgi:hypothetical protein